MLFRTAWYFNQRQNSILSSLVKLRAQHGREGGVSSVNYQRIGAPGIGSGGGQHASSMVSSSNPSKGKSPAPDATTSPLQSLLAGKGIASPRSLLPHELVQVEAQKLLEKLTRPQESFTDVLPDSPMYCVEVGKLFAVSAHFGCSTTTARVAEALKWVEQKGEKNLTTLRQVMSIATPVMNLADGKVAGASFFWGHLYPLVEKSLLSVIRTPPEEVSYEEGLHSRAAIVSIFQLISNLVNASLGRTGMEKVQTSEAQDPRLISLGIAGHLQHIISLLELSTRALSAAVLSGTTGKNKNSEPIMDLSECVAALSAISVVELLIGPPSSLDTTEKGIQSSPRAVLFKLYTTWMEHLRNFSLSSTQQTGNIKPMLVQQLSQVALTVPDKRHSLQLTQYILQLLPSVFSCSSMKELCSLTQLVNKLHMKFGSAIVTPAAVQKIMDACRPKLVLLSESPAFRHVESSILMGTLSRWEEFANGGNHQNKEGQDGGRGGDPRTERNWPFILSNDLVDLLSHRFVSHVNLILMHHMVPFLQGLSRVEAYRQSIRPSSHGQTQHLLLSELHLEPYLEQCMERVILLARERKCNAYEAGSALKAFVELGMDAQRLFVSVEDILCSCLTEPSSGDSRETKVVLTDDTKVSDLTASTSSSFTTSSKMPPSYLPVVKSVELFARELPQDTEEQKQTLALSQRVLKTLHQKAPVYLAQLSSPMELISLFTTLVGDPSRKGATEEEDSPDVESQGNGEAAPSSLKARNHEAIESFLLQVEKLAGECSASELATLALGVAQVSLFQPTLSTSAMNALMARLEAVYPSFPLSAIEFKKILDACCKMNFSRAAPFLCKLLVGSLATSADCGASSSNSTDRKTDFSFHFLSMTSKSVERFCAVMPISARETISIKQAVFNRARVQLLGFQESLHSSMSRRSHAVSELSYLAFCLSRLWIQKSNGQVNTGSSGEEETEKALHRSSLEEDGESNAEEETLICQASNHHYSRELEEVVEGVFELLGDVLEGLLNEMEGREEEEDERRMTHSVKEEEIEPRKLVMIIQAFDNVKVVHSPLMYALLYQLQVVSHRLDPLELSLVMNASLQQGAWNTRVMKRLASDVERKIRDSPLRQCQAILLSLERSNFISPSTHLLPTQIEQSTQTRLKQRTSDSPLETLGRAVLQRMVDLCSTRENLEGLLKKENFGDVMGALRALAFFHYPPQPVFDVFVLVATSRFVKYCIRLCQHRRGVSLTSKEMQQAGLGALQLLQNVFQIRKGRHQRAVSMAVQRALFMLEENCRRVAGRHHRRPSAIPSSDTAVGTGKDLWSIFSAKELAELLKVLQEHQLFYTGKKPGHRRRMLQLYGRLLSAFSRRMAGLASSPVSATSPISLRQMYYALLPLCSAGYLFDIPQSPFLKKNDFFTLFDILTPESTVFGRLSPVSASCLLYSLSFRSSLESISCKRGLKKLQEMFDHLVGKPELSASEALILLRCLPVLQLPKNEALATRITEALLPAHRLGIGNSIDALLALALRRKDAHWEGPLDSLAVQIMRAIRTGFSRRASGGPASEKTKLIQIYRLLTTGNGLVVLAFLDSDGANDLIKQAATELLCQAVCVVAKAYYDSQKSSSLSLSPLRLRRINICIQGSDRSKNSGVLPSHISEICEIWK